MQTSHGSPHLKWATALAVLAAFALPFAYSAVVVPLSPSEQAWAGLAMIVVAVLAGQFPPLRPFVIFLSGFASARYCYWRVTASLNFDSQIDLAASMLLFGAELYGLGILFLGYFQTVHLVERTPPPIRWSPAIDVFIPTYNEPVEVVRRTLSGALAMDWADKTVYVLDDGARPEIERMTKEMGGRYIRRPDNRHAKAGNLNHALARTDGELVAIFDADHVPVRGFLRTLAGFFGDEKVALVQGAQHFFNPDPFEQNLNLNGRVAPEQNFFYQVIQPGNDFWNAAFFCGSCAVLRRSGLESIGGFRTDTVTEDAHTAMELHARGYRSIYYRTPLAAGLATESFAAHVKQRMRWARGMAQILRTDCPLVKRGLSLPQRLNYFNAMGHFFFGVPRLILIVAPLWYLFFGIHPLKASSFEVVAYILPHIGLSTIANSMISRRHRHSFWSAVYEVSIAVQTISVTVAAMIDPRKGKFVVTDKGESKDAAVFDWRNTLSIQILLGLTAAGLILALPLRLLSFAVNGAHASELDSIVLNSFWASANLVMLSAAVCVGIEKPQQRRAPRVARSFACAAVGDGYVLDGRTIDLSESGVRVSFPERRPVPERCRLRITAGDGTTGEFSAEFVRRGQGTAFRFTDVTPDQHRCLVDLMFGPDDSWVEPQYPEDRILVSFWNLLTTPWRATRPRSCETAGRRVSPAADPLVPLPSEEVSR
jgi:cellulose synthase (UDP-forming)